MTKYLSNVCNPQMRPKWSWFKGAAMLLSTAALLGVIACTQSDPYRTVLNNKSPPVTASNNPCTPEEKHMTPEITENYELNFVEFDDQGWLHPVKIKQNGDAYTTQLDFLMQNLHEKMNNDKGDISIILYIHGWKHNASCDDSDVKHFRDILQRLSKIPPEPAQTAKSTSKPRSIVGIYVGWRGQSLNWPLGLDNITFWDRKETALRVAQGSARELLARLRGLQRYYNEKDDNCKPDPKNPSMRPHCKVRMLLIGHSFGGWILYSATSGWLIQTAAAKMDVGGKQDASSEPATAEERFADTVVLINPAFEGSRYEPLHRVAQCQSATAPDSITTSTDAGSPCPFKFRQYDHYESPLLVTITSTADQATGLAFPAGREINSILERPTASNEQSEAITHTPGHIDRYITHELKAVEEKLCPDDSYEAEEKNEHKFFNQYNANNDQGYSLKPGWKRSFCGGAVLTHRADRSNPNSPVWNVRADASIINGHSDIERPAFVAFIRQLYHELVNNSFSENPGLAATATTGTASPRLRIEQMQPESR